MATINLGQIRPVNKGVWNNTTTYTAYDFVQYDNSAYLALQNVPMDYEPDSQASFWVLFGAKGKDGVDGISGIGGVKGDAGDQGIQGIQGKQGEQGIQGLEGDQGEQGIQGLQGKGDQGDQGIQGLKGEQGDLGVQGQQGIQGTSGANGDTGEQGAGGVKGDQGDQGIQGIQGLIGNTGIKGDTGTQGIQGIQGVQGAPASLSDSITLARSDIAASAKAVSLVNTEASAAQNNIQDEVTARQQADTTESTARQQADQVLTDTMNTLSLAVTADDKLGNKKAGEGLVIVGDTLAIDASASASTPIGTIQLIPFRNNELPNGWYFCNNDRYTNTTPQGIALISLSANFKSDWGISNNGSTTNVPNMFYGNRGYFLRAVNSSSRRIGTAGIEHDAIRNMTGSLSSQSNGGFSIAPFAPFLSGVFTLSGGTPLTYQVATYSGRKGSSAIFNASRVVTTSSEVRPINIGMTPAIYLGV